MNSMKCLQQRLRFLQSRLNEENSSLTRMTIRFQIEELKQKQAVLSLAWTWSRDPSQRQA